MNSPQVLQLLAERMPSRNLARLAHFVSKAEAGTLSNEQIDAFNERLREVSREEVDPLIRTTLPYDGEMPGGRKRWALFAIDEEALLVVRILVPTNGTTWNWREIAQDYIKGLGNLMLDAAQGMGVH